MEKSSDVRSNQTSTPPSVSGGADSPDTAAQLTKNQRNVFLGMALNMSWQLALVVLAPVVGGVFIDKGLDTAPIFLFVGLALALLGTVLVLWRTLQIAKQVPVPKLNDAQRRAVAKQYEEDDAE